MKQMDGTWLVAVSAGPDSMALLSMCLESKTACAAAHVNYHHRPEADEEEEAVRLFCTQNNIPLFVRNEPFVWQGNFEAAAREWRYDFFVRIVKENGYRGVLTAHQEDDLIETYIMQEEKNIVPAYYGMREEIMYRGILIRRPLFGYTKAQLRSYCDEHQIRYFIDSTNESDNYTRNRIRHAYVEPMGRLERDMVLREIRMKNAQAQERSCRVATMIRDGRVSLDAYRALEQEDRLALLRKVCDRNSHRSLAWIKEIDHVIAERNDFDIDLNDCRLVQREGSFFVTHKAEPYEYVFADMEELRAFAGTEYFRIAPGEPGVNAVTLSEDDFPLTIRSFMAGDAITQRWGTKSVHRFFVDRHIPLYLRKTWPVVINREKTVVLVPGIGCEPMHFSIKPNFNVIQ